MGIIPEYFRILSAFYSKPVLNLCQILYNGFMFSVILARPESPENIGFVARAMKTTGFLELRLAGIPRLDPRCYKTAVHAQDILDRAVRYTDLREAVSDLQVVYAATAKPRKNFQALALPEAVKNMFELPARTKIGLLFGNERTGLTSDELRRANFLFTIPQARRQPSYNLAAAVLLTLFQIFMISPQKKKGRGPRPLTRRNQEEGIRLILKKLEDKGFIHKTNRRHVTDIVHDIFGRLVLTERDRSFLLALFSKGPDGP
jgi:tRNA/rRNA methyltransferase